jgi:hypothetical protein
LIKAMPRIWQDRVVARLVRLRHVDTNPIGVPTRLWGSDRWARRFGDAERFAKCAIVVAAAYT